MKSISTPACRKLSPCHSASLNSERKLRTLPKRQRPDDRQTGGPAVIPESVTQALAVININEAEVEESASALAMVPTISEDVREVMPTMIEAKIETDRLLLQPMTTLSQSFDNVYESVAILSEAFSGIASTFNAVNTSLSTLSEPVNLSM